MSETEPKNPEKVESETPKTDKKIEATDKKEETEKKEDKKEVKAIREETHEKVEAVSNKKDQAEAKPTSNPISEPKNPNATEPTIKKPLQVKNETSVPKAIEKTPPEPKKAPEAEEEKKTTLEKLAPTTPELTDLGKAVVFGVTESAKGVGRFGYCIGSPTLGILNSGRKLITDLFNPKRLFKKPGSYFANIARMGTSALKGIFNIATSPFTIFGGFYRGFYETLRVLDKNVLQEFPVIRHISKHIIMPATGFVNSVVSGLDQGAYNGYQGLDELDKKVKAKQFEK